VEPGERGEQAVLERRGAGGCRAGAPRLQVRLYRQAQFPWRPYRRWSGRWAHRATSLATPGSNTAEEERHNTKQNKRSDFGETRQWKTAGGEGESRPERTVLPRTMVREATSGPMKTGAK